MLKKAAYVVLAFMLTMVIIPVKASDPPVLEEEVDAPLDGGLSLLLAAGAALGGKKVYDTRK